MNYTQRIATLAMMILFIIAGCRNAPPHEDHESGSHDEHQVEPHVDLDDDSQSEPDDHESEDVITLDADELREFGITFAIAEAGVINDTTSLVGEIVLNPDQVAHVVSRADGIGSSILHTIGDRVEVGEILAVIDSPALAESKAEYLSRGAHAALAIIDLARTEAIYTNTIQLLSIITSNPDVDTLREALSGLDIGAQRGSLITTYAELRSAEAVYGREKTLFNRQITSEYEFLGAESELKKAMANFQAVRDDLSFANRRELDKARRSNVVADVSLQAVKRRLFALGLTEEEVLAVEHEPPSQLSRYVIRAPISGVIIERHIVRGESIDAGEQVFVVIDLSSVWGHLTLYQRDLASVQEGQKVKVYATNAPDGIDARIDYVGLIIDTATRTTTARIVLDNPNGNWRPGMFIRAEVATEEYNAAVIVPRSAIQEIDNETVMFVQTVHGIEHRDIQVGKKNADLIEIITGLQVGERFVVTGGLALKAEMNKASLEHAGHAH